MQSVYHLNANELDDRFLESLRVLFGDRKIEIVVSSVDETEYLLNHPANREHLLRAMKNAEEGKNLITVNLEDLQLVE
jgi:antitoxin YefM